MTAQEAREKQMEFLNKKEGQLESIFNEIDRQSSNGESSARVKSLSDFTVKQLIDLGYSLQKAPIYGPEWFIVSW